MPNLRSHARAGGEPFSLPARIHESDQDLERDPMKIKKRPKKPSEQEPVGIVISGGPVSDAPPVFAAYVWGPAPERKRAAPEPQAA
jgi:hypothetical protein